MNRLKWWLRIVGAFYLLLGIGFFPLINEARLPFMLPIDAPASSIAYKALIDWMFTFGLDLLVVGGFLIYASRNPARHFNLVWLVVLLEAVRGVLDDIYYISRGYASAPFYIGFIVVHLIIITTGIAFVRHAQAQVQATSSLP